MVRIGIVGSREYPRMLLVKEFIFALPGACTVVSGGERGVDQEAERWAKFRMMRKKIFSIDRPNYVSYTKEEYQELSYARNRELVANSDIIVAFWDGKSDNAKHTLDVADELKIPTFIVPASAPGDTERGVMRLALSVITQRLEGDHHD